MENYFYLNEKNEQKGPVSPEELIRNGGNEKLPRVEKRYGPMAPGRRSSRTCEIVHERNLHAFITPAIPSHTTSTTGKQ